MIKLSYDFRQTSFQVFFVLLAGESLNGVQGVKILMDEY